MTGTTCLYLAAELARWIQSCRPFSYGHRYLLNGLFALPHAVDQSGNSSEHRWVELSERRSLFRL